MRDFDLNQLIAQSKTANRPWLEFLKCTSLSMGIYRLQAGQADAQLPHSEDEVYYVVAGAARFRSGEQQLAVGPGSILFVERDAEHRFFEITEDLIVLVFFAPPEGSQRKANA